MAHHEQYQLRVTAGATYDPATHHDVPVNTGRAVSIASEHLDARIHVRIRDYRGLPKSSPPSSPYFDTPQHPHDRYSISFSFRPRRAINGHDLVFGNDFDHPIRDRLPPLFDKAFGIVKWWIDPGLDGDVYGDEPYLYGPLLSSINVLCIGDKASAGGEKEAEEEAAAADGVVVYEEGAQGDGELVRQDLGIPDDGRSRQKHFLTEQHRMDFEFEAGREYKCDFFNPYLDFNEFALKLGYGLPAISIMGHWDGQPLRYVLRDRGTDTELFVVIFQLVPTDEAKKEAGVQSSEQKFEEVHGGDDDDELD